VVAATAKAREALVLHACDGAVWWQLALLAQPTGARGRPREAALAQSALSAAQRQALHAQADAMGADAAARLPPGDGPVVALATGRRGRCRACVRPLALAVQRPLRQNRCRYPHRNAGARAAHRHDMTHPPDRMALVTVRDLIRVGHPLPFRVLDAQERLLLNAGQILSDEAQFESLVERGAWAERALVEAERAARAAQTHAAAKAPTTSLFDRWERLLWQFDKLARSMTRKSAPAGALEAYFASLVELIDVDPDVALFLCVRQDDRRFALYALTHGLHCAVICTLSARQLGWPAPRIASLGCAALTMNLAIMELQALMAEQDTPPTARQLDTIRAHPQGSVALLRAAGVADEEWLNAVVQHHEQHDGAGYPSGTTQIGEAAQLLRAVDVYMAKISPRAKRPPMAPQMAARQLFQQHPGDPLAMAVIRTVGVHPPGSLVVLRSGEVAVSVRRPTRGTQPLVATLSDAKGRPNLQTHRRDTAEPEFTVQGPLTDATAFARVLPERVYGFIES
jgi:HD-GYP domain-containing protein (c-di-GMP phosphodiesterase class II)